MMKSQYLILLPLFSIFLFSCSDAEQNPQEKIEAQGIVSWDLNEESFEKSGSWTYCDTEDFSGNFVIYGTNRIEGEGIIVSIDDNTDVVSAGQAYSFDQNSVGQLIYDDGKSNRWSSINEGGSGVATITLFTSSSGTVVEGKFSGTLVNNEDGSTRIIEDGFFSVSCI